MNPRLRIPLAVLAGAVAVAAFWAVRPAGDATPIDSARAAEVATDPGALVPFLRFAGTDSVKVKPDQAEVQVTATATEKTSAAALDEASKKLESVIGRMQQLGIPDEDLVHRAGLHLPGLRVQGLGRQRHAEGHACTTSPRPATC